jgi:hypothetical protein
MQIEPDLTRMNRDGANLDGYNFSRAKFPLSSLRGASLSEADFRMADCSFVDFTGANFARSLLMETDFAQSSLDDANLTGAGLISTDFFGSRLDGADLTDAVFGATKLANTSLSRAVGLETVRHLHGSSIGIDTFFRSGGLPEAFLRGCGMPDEFIIYAASLVGKPIEYYSCFLSYSSKDTEFAKRLYADLQARGIRTWFAPEDLKIGDPLKPVIDQSVRSHEKLLVVLSEHSVASSWVEREVEAAMRQEQKQSRTSLFPIRLDDTIFDVEDGWATDLRQRHIGDFREWKSHDYYQKAFERLIRDLKKSL